MKELELESGNAEAIENLVDEINDLFGGLGSRSCPLLDKADHYILEGTRSLAQSC